MWPPEHERFADRAAAGRLLATAVAEHLRKIGASAQQIEASAAQIAGAAVHAAAHTAGQSAAAQTSAAQSSAAQVNAAQVNVTRGAQATTTAGTATTAGMMPPTGAGTDATAPTRGPLVLALPKGGVPVGVALAEALGAEFDLVISRKIGLPWQVDHGVGAIAENGPAVFDLSAVAAVGLTVSDLSPSVARERVELRRRQERYRGSRPAPDVAGRVVVVVDDGLATGVTARAAARALRAGKPAHLVFAAPVCAAESVDLLAADVDAVIDIHSPREFHALGLYYSDFAPLTDNHVLQMCTRVWGEQKVPATV